MLTITDLLNQLASRVDNGSLSDSDAVALSDGLAELTEAMMRHPVARPVDLLRKIAVVRTCIERGWDAVLPGYLDQIEADLRSL